MNELSGKVIKSIKHGFNKDHESIITIETEDRLFHYKIVGHEKDLELISTTGFGFLPEYMSKIGGVKC